MNNQEKRKKLGFLKGSIQEYIYLSYLYLLILGTLSYSIYYAFLGINIINYSNLLDILLSPIVIITKDIMTPIAMGVYIVSGVLLFLFLEKRTKKSLQNNIPAEKEIKLQKQYQSFKNAKFLIPIIGTFAFYLGYAIGGGYKLNNRIQTGDFEVNRLIEFSNGETQEVKLLGLNNQYIFYVHKGEKQVITAPISGNIKRIKKIKKSNKE
ncbi:hypothetical protein U6A24_09100 [Aquimarina gracilis]|uniref:Uncharacterized protein n=1 Tax=Aquimarina gracilis TaxID=874422 RepID=A0ABU5ZU78_9FLAO|nr:hypothetical protein [Aquimarina gracilis]MEB3345615.1 hypothetical protein [Aquimarina gracilis]